MLNGKTVCRQIAARLEDSEFRLDRDWTKRVSRIAAGVFRQHKVGHRRVVGTSKFSKDGTGRSEYLTIDVFGYVGGPRQWGRPIAVCETENSYDPQHLAGCAWKLLCVRADARFLVAYYNDKAKAHRKTRCYLERLLRRVGGEFPTKGDGGLWVILAECGRTDRFKPELYHLIGNRLRPER